MSVKIIDPAEWDAWCNACGAVVEWCERIEPFWDASETNRFASDRFVVHPCGHDHGFMVKRPGPTLSEVSP